MPTRRRSWFSRRWLIGIRVDKETIVEGNGRTRGSLKIRDQDRWEVALLRDVTGISRFDGDTATCYAPMFMWS